MRIGGQGRPIFLSLFTVLLIGACGGDKGGSADDPLDPDDPVAGDSTTSQQRMVTLNSLEQVVRALPGQNFTAETQQLVQAIRSNPRFEDAGASSDGTVWGRFKGGATVYIIHSAPAEGSPGANDPALLPLSGTAANATVSPAAIDGTTPNSNRFRLFDGIGSFFASTDPRQDIFTMLVSNGYMGTVEDGTVDALRTVNGEGIVYFRTHGGLGSFNSGGNTRQVYALWTASPALDSVAEARDLALMSDLRTGRVVYMLFRASGLSRFTVPGVGNLFHQDRHYGITEDFVSHYMKFSPNSLVYIDACQGAAHPSFVKSFNASVFAGWTERAAFSAIGPTAKYVFDRMLGANRFAPEIPEQRPFEYDALPRDPKFGKNKIYGYSTWSTPSGPVQAELTFTRNGGEFGILAPSILGLNVNELQNELNLHGYFGPNPGAEGIVTIDDGSGPLTLAVTNWTPSLIRATLPSTGANSSGNVVVTVRGHRSNMRQILLYAGTFVYTLREAGSLTQRIEMDVRGRVDPHDVRASPGVPPVATLMQVFNVNPNTEMRFATSGSFTAPANFCTVTEEWGGSGSLRASMTPTAAGWFVYEGLVNARLARLELAMGASASQGATQTIIQMCPAGQSSFSGPIDVGMEDAIMDVSSGGNLKFIFNLDAQLSLPGSTRQRTIASKYSTGSAALTLQWSTIAPRPAYNANLPR